MDLIQVSMQAMKDAELEKSIHKCCMLIGCLVPCQDYMPLLLGQLDAAADPISEGASIGVLTALIQGAGRIIYPVSLPYPEMVHSTWLQPAVRYLDPHEAFTMRFALQKTVCSRTHPFNGTE